MTELRQARAHGPTKRQIDPDHHHPPIAALWCVVAGGALLFALMAVAVSTDVIDGLDRALLTALRNADDLSDAWGPTWFEETAADMTALGGYPVLITISLITVSVLVLLRHREAAAFLTLALVGGSALSSGVKMLFSRARPDLVDHMDKTFTSSFPSAHAMVSMLAYLTLAAIAIRFVPRHSVRVFIPLTAMGLALVIGASRVYLGVHWPSDVIAGWSLGISWAASCWLAAHYLSRSVSDAGAFGHSRT